MSIVPQLKMFLNLFFQSENLGIHFWAAIRAPSTTLQ